MDSADVRAADRDRDRVIDELARAAGEGRLTYTEFEERCAAAQRAVMLSDLADLTADLGGGEPLPVPVAAPVTYRTPPPGAAVTPTAAASRGRGVKVAVYALVGLLALGLAGGLVSIFSGGSERIAVSGVGRVIESGTTVPLTAIEPVSEAAPPGRLWIIEGSALTVADFAGEAAREFDIGGNYRQFRATLANVPATESGTSLVFRVLVDGQEVAVHRLAAGAGEAISIDVTNAQRLRIEIRSEGDAPTTAAVADGSLTPA